VAGTNLVRTTLTGVRPLGVRGEPLHQAHEQIRGVVRRRLGERHARLLAEPQPDETGRRIDWYTDLPDAVVPFAELADERKASLLAEVETLSQDIANLAASLKASPSDDAQLTGRALELTSRRPSDDYIFLVGDQPVVVAWGYEPEAAGSLLPPPMVPAAAPPAPPPATVAAAPATVLASGPVAMAAAAPFPWLRWLLIGLFAILLALIASYFLRQCSPVGPDVAVTQLPPPPAPPAPPPLPDPSVGLRDDLGAAQNDEAKLRATLASLRDELVTKRADCKPPEPPKPPPAPPPPVVEKKPDPPKPPPKPPQVVEKKPDPPPPPPPPAVPPAPPGDDRMRMPKTPTNDYTFLQGCWRTDTFKHGPQIRPGYAQYCFDARGNGSMEFHFDNGVVCRAPATARFNGGQLAVTDADTECQPRGRWAQDHLYCQPGADGVAFCSGTNRTERWTVNLHRVR
jgi:hypothetical protein